MVRCATVPMAKTPPIGWKRIAPTAMPVTMSLYGRFKGESDYSLADGKTSGRGVRAKQTADR